MGPFLGFDPPRSSFRRNRKLPKRETQLLQERGFPRGRGVHSRGGRRRTILKDHDLLEDRDVITSSFSFQEISLGVLRHLRADLHPLVNRRILLNRRNRGHPPYYRWRSPWKEYLPMELLHKERSFIVLLEPPDPFPQNGPVRFRGGSRASQKKVKGFIAETAVVRVPDGVGLHQDTAWGMGPAMHLSKVASDPPRASRMVAGNL